MQQNISESDLEKIVRDMHNLPKDENICDHIYSTYTTEWEDYCKIVRDIIPNFKNKTKQ